MGKPIYSGTQKVVVHPTRFPGLGYGSFGPGHWQFIDTSQENDAQVGPIYPARHQLEVDIDRYAKERGCESNPVRYFAERAFKPRLIPSPELTEEVLRAWIEFRRGHDLESLKMSCCDVTRRFNETMQKFEDALMPSWKERISQ